MLLMLRADTKRLLCCDNLEMLSAQEDGAVDLIYIDPPFNTGAARSRAGSQYDDRWPDGIRGFVEFLRPRLTHMHRVLAPSGTLYVHLDWRSVHYVKVLLDEVFGHDNFLNEIVWHYRSGGVAKRWFSRKHDTVLAYARHRGDHTFHPSRGGTFRTEGLQHDDAGRPYKNTRKGRLYFDARGPMLTDVWDLPILSTVATERTGYPDQKPRPLIDRIITASSNPGDVVADYFCGSGTTLESAVLLKRDYMGCDSNPQAIPIAAKRIEHALQTLNTPSSHDSKSTRSPADRTNNQQGRC